MSGQHFVKLFKFIFAVLLLSLFDMLLAQHVLADESPDVIISRPYSGETVSQVFTISGTAADDNNVEKVEVRVDGGPWLQAEGKTFWNYKWITYNIQISDFSFVFTPRKPAFTRLGAISQNNLTHIIVIS